MHVFAYFHVPRALASDPTEEAGDRAQAPHFQPDAQRPEEQGQAGARWKPSWRPAAPATPGTSFAVWSPPGLLPDTVSLDGLRPSGALAAVLGQFGCQVHPTRNALVLLAHGPASRGFCVVPPFTCLLLLLLLPISPLSPYLPDEAPLWARHRAILHFAGGHLPGLQSPFTCSISLG